MNWFVGRGSTVALVLSCVLAVLGAGVAWLRDAPAPIAETRQRQEAPAARSREGDATARQREEAATVARQAVVVSPSRRVHILDGDRTGGGHRPGLGIPGKSEFPAGWSDDRIIEAIESVANDPAAFRRVEADGRTVVSGRRDGVDLRVVVERDGRSVVTGYPTNMPRNPPR